MIWKCVNFLRNSFQYGNVVSAVVPKDPVSKVSAMFIQTTSVTCKEPMKKKKRLDPALVKHREDRKKKRIEKEIRRLSKIAQQYKPIEENEVSMDLKNTMESRRRTNPKLSDEEIFERHTLHKQWSQYKSGQFKDDMSMIKNVLKSRTHALKELRAESEELYKEAIQLDLNLLPFRAKGVTISPPIKDYNPIDGDIIDKTRKWEIE